MDGKDLPGARNLVASMIWSREDPLPSTDYGGSQHNSSSIELCVMLFFKSMRCVLSLHSTWS